MNGSANEVDEMTDTTFLDLEVKKLREENCILREIIKTYQGHLEKVVEHKSIEKYRNTVEKN